MREVFLEDDEVELILCLIKKADLKQKETADSLAEKLSLES